MAINLQGANKYFHARTHVKAGIWAAFAKETPDAQEAAIAQAKRVLARIVKRALLSPAEKTPAEDPADPATFPRDDFAVYEQALYSLVNAQIADGSMATPKFIAGRTKSDEARERQRDEVATEALQWLFRGRVMISRG